MHEHWGPIIHSWEERHGLGRIKAGGGEGDVERTSEHIALG